MLNNRLQEREFTVLARNAGPSQSSQYIGTDHKDRSSRPRFVELTNRFHVAVRLFSNRSQMTSKCGENKEMAHEPQASASLQMFLPHFDIFCDLLLNYMESICFLQSSEEKKDRYSYLPRTA